MEMTFSVNPHSLKRLQNKLKRHAEKVARLVQEETFDLGNDIRNRIIESISREKSAGRVYTHYLRTNRFGQVFPYKERSKPHQASKPGDPPNTDTGMLVKSIPPPSTLLNGDVVRIVVTAPHGKLLEFGTKAMEARPFMRPAFKELTKGFNAELTRKISAMRTGE